MLEGAPLLENVENKVLMCETQAKNELVYYASFPDEGADTATQAKFTSSSATDFTLLCSVGGQSRYADINFDVLDC